MNPLDCLPFPAGIWAVDAEYRHPDGHPLPTVWCLVAKDLRSGTTYRLWMDELAARDRPPFPVGADALVVCHSATAEMSVFNALGWPMPINVLCTRAEFRVLSNRVRIEGVPPPGSRLIDALAYLGLPMMGAAEKAEMQALAIRGAPFSPDECRDLLEYCEDDVVALERLLPVLLDHLWKVHLDRRVYLGRALFRGNYLKALTLVTKAGIPLDVGLLERTQAAWGAIRQRLIEAVDNHYGIFIGSTFKQDRFAAYLARNRIAWPRTPSGRLAMDEDTWKAAAARHPELQPLKELIATVDKMKLSALRAGPDGRSRNWLGPFSASTGRNAPSGGKAKKGEPPPSLFPFQPATWARGFIKPEPGTTLVYADWSAQEIAVAACLSGDDAMLADYENGDIYLNFGRSFGYVPIDATKQSHSTERDVLKTVLLASNYGAGIQTIAVNADRSTFEIAKLLQQHRLRYRRFWQWLDAEVAAGIARGFMRSRLGWHMKVLEGCRPTSLLNWHMQSHGASMLHVAVILAVRAGLKVIAPVHDALLVEVPTADATDHIDVLVECMHRASAVVLGGFRVRVGVERYSFPDRYMDKRGSSMWNTVMSLLLDVDRAGTDDGSPVKLDVDDHSVDHPRPIIRPPLTTTC